MTDTNERRHAPAAGGLIVPEAGTDPLRFLDGGGEAARMIRARDWASHPLGPPEGWSPEFRVSLSLVLNSPESMILAWGPDLHFFFNDAYVPLLGPRLAWAMGERFDRVWADAWEQAKPIIAAAQAGGAERFVDLPWKLDTDRGAADTWFTFSYSRVLDGDGEVAGLFILTSETTERVLSDVALRASQDRLAALNARLEREVAERTADRNALWLLSNDIMLRCTFEGVMTAVNPAWTEMLGWEEHELVGTSLFDLIHPDDLARTVEGARQLSEGVGHARFDNRYRHKDGSHRWISWTTRPAEGRINAVGRDVTADKEQAEALARAEDSLRQAQKMEAVGQLTGGVAHDFNNLLTIIRSSVDFLRRPDLPEARRIRYMDAVSETVDRAAKLTGQLLAFARRQALHPEVFEVGRRLQGVIDMLNAITGARIRIRTEFAAEPCHVHADVSQFETALVNLAVNARDAMHGEGTLTIRVDRERPLPEIRGHAGAPGPFVAIAVADEGVGIDPANLARVFEPFFTTKEVGKGTGLGLSQVIGFTKQSGGDVDVASGLGRGTTFTLYLPQVSARQAEAPDAGAAEEPADERALCVLVVEDNLEVGRFCTQILEDLGHHPVWAHNAEAALAEMERIPFRFEAVFSDVVMPGMGGIELARRLRADHPDLPVILTSGYSDVLAKEGTHGFELVRKPYSAAEVARVFRSVVARMRAADADAG